MRLFKFSLPLVLIIILITITARFGNGIFIHFESNAPSKSIGTPAGGSLTNGKRLPSPGENFRTYSYIGSTIGRTNVHHKLRSAILEAYHTIYQIDPKLVFVFAEASRPNGGRLYPHKTHKNGLAVDFFVPVKNKIGQSKPLPTSIVNEYGYRYNFNEKGIGDKYDIDFNAIALHLTALYKSCRKQGIYINLVVIAPEYLPLIFQSQSGENLEGKLPFYRKKLEIRHDEHYHIVFSNPD